MVGHPEVGLTRRLRQMRRKRPRGVRPALAPSMRDAGRRGKSGASAAAQAGVRHAGGRAKAAGVARACATASVRGLAGLLRSPGTCGSKVLLLFDGCAGPDPSPEGARAASTSCGNRSAPARWARRSPQCGAGRASPRRALRPAGACCRNAQTAPSRDRPSGRSP